MSLAQQSPQTDVFFDEIVQDSDVCDNCYLRTHETVELWDGYIRGPDELRIRDERHTEITEHGLFCRCGSDTKAQIRSRSVSMLMRHVKNLHRTLEAKGYEVDRTTLVQETRRRLVEDRRNDTEQAIAEAVSEALTR